MRLKTEQLVHGRGFGMGKEGLDREEPDRAELDREELGREEPDREESGKEKPDREESDREGSDREGSDREEPDMEGSDRESFGREGVAGTDWLGVERTGMVETGEQVDMAGGSMEEVKENYTVDVDREDVDRMNAGYEARLSWSVDELETGKMVLVAFDAEGSVEECFL